MPHISHWIEKAIIQTLSHHDTLTIQEMAASSNLSEDQARRGIEWLLAKGVIRVARPPHIIIRAGPAAEMAARQGLPERRMVDMLRDGQDTGTIKGILGADYGAALGICIRGGWVAISDGEPTLRAYPDVMNGEVLLKSGRLLDGVPPDTAELAELSRRPGYTIQSKIPPGYGIVSSAKTQMTHDHTRIDVEAPSAILHVARTHPLCDIISEIREAFVKLGFGEISGNLVQSAFWNFDALFTPQDHPARDMQDTFYVRGGQLPVDSTDEQRRRVSKMHTDKWHYRWRDDISAEAVLRTHTTCVTIRYLAEHNPSDARIFSLGRVFRNEKPGYKHLVEFHQAEGVVVGPNVSLRDLMGIQRQFYHMMGLDKVKFWPTFFPYTEPSLQSMVYNDTLDRWVELFGMGIFRPEVTEPLGISGPVLAWGGGIERIAMLRYMTHDVREFYANNLGWLRGASLCR